MLSASTCIFRCVFKSIECQYTSILFTANICRHGDIRLISINIITFINSISAFLQSQGSI